MKIAKGGSGHGPEHGGSGSLPPLQTPAEVLEERRGREERRTPERVQILAIAGDLFTLAHDLDDDAAVQLTYAAAVLRRIAGGHTNRRTGATDRRTQ